MSNRCRRHHRTLLQPNINTATTTTCTIDCYSCCNSTSNQTEQTIQLHPTGSGSFPLRSGTSTISSSSSSFMSSSSSTLITNKRRRTTRYLISSIFMFCTLTIVSWSTYLSRSHSIQQLLLESRHPLAGNNNHYPTYDDEAGGC